MTNPYIELHKAFRAAGAEVLLSSGQACVLYGIAAFSKDGDWVIRETPASCRAVLGELERRGASCRLGAPLDVQWLAQGWTSRFELHMQDGYRARADFVSRPPRVPDIGRLWQMAVHVRDVDLVDVEAVILLKQTRCLRDYSVIGALADVCGYHEGNAELALRYLQDYDLLSNAVARWPDMGAAVDRPAVRLLTQRASRREVVAALAVEQDECTAADARRVSTLREAGHDYARGFTELKAQWVSQRTDLAEQHSQLIALAAQRLGTRGHA
jgi:hypothetical protein